jgi:hypothetical protein
LLRIGTYLQAIETNQGLTEMTTNSIFGDFFSIDSKHIKSYATKENLEAALVKMGVTKMDRPLAVCTSNGRHTAIFPVSACQGNLTRFPGFMKLG